MSMTFYFNPKTQQNAKDKFKIHLKNGKPLILKLGLSFTKFSSSLISLILLSSILLNVWFKILDNFVLWVHQAQMLPLQTS